MLNWTKSLGQLPKAWLVGISIFMVGVVGGADYFTGYEISFSTFYLIAVVVAAWFVGKTCGALISVLSVASELLGDVAAGVHYSNGFVPVWNAIIALAFYVVVVWLVASLSSLHRDLEIRVRQRTTALTAEMAERERLEKELLEMSESERRRIGHDLHDSLGQQLTGAALAGQVLEEKLAMKSLPEAAGAAQVVALIETAIELTRSLSRGLHPMGLENSGLTPAFEELASFVAERFQVSCRCECAHEVFIRDIAVATHLYRISQEAITNAVKHGQPRKILLRVEAIGGGFTLTIQDDGSGLPTHWRESRGMGLRIMAHRATMIGAKFEIGPAPGSGTIVTCSLTDLPP